VCLGWLRVVLFVRRSGWRAEGVCGSELGWYEFVGETLDAAVEPRFGYRGESKSVIVSTSVPVT
jgi:hypothetical protein